MIDQFNVDPINFYVQRNSSFDKQDVPIEFNVELVNSGGAMDLRTVIFTAPRPGIYFFSFSGISNDISIGQYVNNKRISSGYGTTSSSETFIVQSALHLNAGDKVSVKIFDGGALYDDNDNHYTHFIGWLGQVEISSCLIESIYILFENNTELKSNSN